MPLQQTTLENIEAKEEIAHKRFQLDSIITFFYGDISHFCQYVFKVICCKKKVYLGKGFIWEELLYSVLKLTEALHYKYVYS